MRSHRPSSFVFQLLRSALLIASLGGFAIVPPASALEPGDAAPDFAVPSLAGGADVSLASHRGKLVYLDFWASWCAPCLTSLPQLDELQSELGTENFQVLAVNVDTDPDKARRLLVKYGITYPSASDPEGGVPSAYDISTMPTSFLIDEQGVIQYVHKGFRQGDITTLRERIEGLMSVPAAPAQ